MEHIRIARDGGVGVITIDRRERFNALDAMTARDLRQAARAMARDGAVRCVILRGTGGVFCSGADLKYIRAGGDEDSLGDLHPDARGVPCGYGEIFKHILAYLHGTISEIRRGRRAPGLSPRSRARHVGPRRGRRGLRRRYHRVFREAAAAILGEVTCTSTPSCSRSSIAWKRPSPRTKGEKARNPVRVWEQLKRSFSCHHRS